MVGVGGGSQSEARATPGKNSKEIYYYTYLFIIESATFRSCLLVVFILNESATNVRHSSRL